MIDVENQVFTACYNAVHTLNEQAYITGTYVDAPPSFPCVSIIQENNVVVASTQDTSNQENHASVMFEVNVYSNKESGKKAECKALLSCVDNVLAKYNFTRIMASVVPNIADASIYRMTARYTAIVGKNETIYRG